MDKSKKIPAIYDKSSQAKRLVNTLVDVVETSVGFGLSNALAISCVLVVAADVAASGLEDFRPDMSGEQLEDFGTRLAERLIELTQSMLVAQGWKTSREIEERN